MTLLVFLGTFLTDQLSKSLAEWLGGAVVNTGISFGWLSQIRPGILTVFLMLIGLTLWKTLEKEWRRYELAAAVFWAGALSNLTDRILLGGITDWLQLPLLSVKNNLADIFMSLALIYIVVKEIQRYAARRHS